MLRIRELIIFVILLSCAWSEENDTKLYDELDEMVGDSTYSEIVKVQPTPEMEINAFQGILASDRSSNLIGKVKIGRQEEMPNRGCGFANSKSQQPADDLTSRFGEFNWMIRIMADDTFIGSGTLIAPDIVLTTAGLVYEYVSSNLTVIAGEWDVNSENEIYPHLSRTVHTIISHSNYIEFTNDIALLVLRISFSRQPNINTICLSIPITIVDQDNCISLAWPQEGSKPLQHRLAIQSDEACSQLVPKTYVRGNKLESGFMCATHLDNAPDLNVGAALFCPIQGVPNRYTQLGIFIGTENRTGTAAELFVNVNHFMPWIYKQLGPRRTDLKHYLPFV
ncbi:phenoloxidase-activating factor 2-like [Drosophila sulfurigaster albostrigata]|uniref:phenoloxidase-activating factor 2-like n=1 Tax=Drosophila sulfurigaster albostrigata TaxID=89887 RepID=UPI002D219D15|nr:phenoloxidase-activating factor 2-like [Drosophila sulfurigaster albostrigata]